MFYKTKEYGWAISTSMYKAILFDLGNVVIAFDFVLGYRRIEALSGIPAAEVRSRLIATDLYRRLESGLIQPETFAAQVQTAVGFECEYRAFQEAWNAIFLPESLIPANFLAGLKRNYKLLIVSNTNAIHFEMLRNTYPILQTFDGFVVSHEIGVMKPDPRYYEAALATAGCPAENCLFIDDLPDNVEGASLAGMDAIQFHSFERLKPELIRRGISWS